ncbi:hypothetical protein TNCV_630431 [Trichonephila clavipes]|nr:hypothetical protein TNCV_630431 [Trichonephila clavipes]
MPKSNAQRGKEFRERKKKGKLAESPVEKVTKKQKNSANSSSAITKSRLEYIYVNGDQKRICVVWKFCKYRVNAEHQMALRHLVVALREL